MKLVFTVVLDNRHREDAYLLEETLKDSVVDFNRRTRAEAHMKPVRQFADDADVMVRLPITGR